MCIRDRVRTIADGVAPSDYGRHEAFRVHQALKRNGPVTVPREFVFMAVSYTHLDVYKRQGRDWWPI